MWAMSCNSYGNLPYNMLIACTRHPELTVDSEKHLSDALLVWLAANPELSECSSCLEDDCTDVLKQGKNGAAISLSLQIRALMRFLV